MTFIELAYKIIEEERLPLTPDEIWKSAEQKGYTNQLNSKGKTPWATLGAKLYTEVKDNKDSDLITIGNRPKKFCLKKYADDNTITIEKEYTTQKNDNRICYLEKDLHRFLAYYAYSYLKTYTKTISHSKSNKNEYGEWLHPDMVGCYFPLEEWNSEVVEFSSAIGNLEIRLYSFELKRELNISNLRESFFQAVSNSSWSHQGYLVASEISNNDDFHNELLRLSSSFGIGVIHLDINDPDSSEVKYPAKIKEKLDWETINKLSMNKDFEDFLKRVRNDLKSKEIRKEMYDRVLPPEELINFIRK
ncbi:protein of unknown function DUF511 [Candidatus Magnetoovum chiemensis]|nr:protein of unknown function DUF511 [Candidatus Magnetoovum chiemensis]